MLDLLKKVIVLTKTILLNWCNVQAEFIFALVSPGGGGKTFFLKKLVKLGFKKCVSTTTRKPRAGEVHGIDYYFVEEENFNPLDMIEFTYFGGHYYGITKAEINQKLKDYKKILVVVELDGVKSLKKLYGDKLKMIYFHNELDVLKERMMKRGDGPNEIVGRLELFERSERFFYQYADFIVHGDWKKSKWHILDYMLNLKPAIEIEKKYTTSITNQDDAFLVSLPKDSITQVYIEAGTPDEEIRIRQKNTHYEKTVKSKSNTEVRSETTVSSSQSEFEKAITNNNPFVSKLRFYYPLLLNNGMILKAEIDLFSHCSIPGLSLVEFEFYSKEQMKKAINDKSFKAQDWILEDVTSVRDYKNANLAIATR